MICTDNSFEFGTACEDLSWSYCTSTLHRSETNGIAERAVRSVKDGTSGILLPTSMKKWWALSMECYCSLRNVQDLLSDVKTPHERRFGEPYVWASNSFSSDSCEETSQDSSNLAVRAAAMLRQSGNILDIARAIWSRSHRVLGFVSQLRVHLPILNRVLPH